MTAGLLRGVLILLRWLLIRASRTNPDYRAALSGDLCIDLSTDDGVSMHFVVRDRQFVPDAGRQPPDLSLNFRSSTTALRFLLARDPLADLLDGMAATNIALTGDLMLLLWFQGRVQLALPFAALRGRRTRLPGSTIQPVAESGTRRQVERQPATDELATDWPSAIAAREESYMVQVARGRPRLPF